MSRGEINWKRRDEEGQKVQVCAEKSERGWLFFHRARRFESWEPLDEPTLEDCEILLDGIIRRVNRKLLRPEEVQRFKQWMREQFPDQDIA